MGLFFSYALKAPSFSVIIVTKISKTCRLTYQRQIPVVVDDEHPKLQRRQCHQHPLRDNPVHE